MRRRFLSLLLGLVVTLVASEVLLAAGWQGFAWVQARSNLASAAVDGAQVRILCLGESTTAVAAEQGGRHLVPAAAWPAQLETALNARQARLDFHVVNAGVMGGTSTLALAQLQQLVAEQRPHVIIALMGMKDTPGDRLPGLRGLPDWVSSLRTARLYAWLVESAALRRNAIVTDVRTIDDIPPAMRKLTRQAGVYVRETRAIGALDSSALSDLEVAAYYWYIGRLQKAEQLTRAVITEHGVGYNLLVRVLVARGQKEEAQRLIEEAIARQPDEAMHHVARAELRSDAGDLEGARQELTATLAAITSYRAPEVVGPHVQLALADVCLQQGEVAAARAILDTVELRRHPEADGVFPPLDALRDLARARAHVASGTFWAAERILRTSLERLPSDHESLWLLSSVYRRTGRHHEEVAIRNRLLRSTGRMSDYLELAQLYRISGQPERAPEVMEQAVATIPSVPNNYRHLYDAAKQAGAPLVVMQYPSYGLDLLGAYAPASDGVVFIDNEHIFDADPDAYFHEPRFPNGFSHYTAAGARLLAERAAGVVLPLLEGP